ncbi:MAG: DedA family protein [Bacteroidota bacterium]|jgi:membrane protein DedA with SNARE-associated domain
MSDFILTLVINYGSPLIAVVLFLGALGFPVGASVLVIAAGAFSEQGILAWHTTVLLGLFGAVLGDILSFGLGYYARDGVNARFGRSPAWKSARDTFDRRAGLAIYLTRFLVTSLAIPTNLIAGGSGIRFRRFLTWDILGELTWILLYGGLGFWFGSQWEVLSNFISNFGGLLLGLVLLGIGIWVVRGKMKVALLRKEKVSEQ